MDDDQTPININDFQNKKSEDVSPRATSEASSPKDLHDKLEGYLKETEGLVLWLQEGLKKGAEQLKAIKSFDEKIAQIGGGVLPIDTKGIETSMEDIRNHVGAIEELHERIKSDLTKVEQISSKISEILNQYQ